MAPIRVVLAEDHYLVREGVRRLIQSQPELELAAVCEDFDSLITAIDEEGPDVVLTDIRMPPTGTNEGIRAADYLRETHPDAGVVVLSQYVDPEYALQFLEHGSKGRGYLLKERVSDIDQLLAAIRVVAAGGSVIDPKVIDALVAARSRAQSPLSDLTTRESEVLSEMAQGKNNAAIAASLVLSERAIEKHINSLFSKLGLSAEPDVSRRVKAVLLFLADDGG
ncbi:MAG: response regulator transcription factor [Actinomycetota bacterium]|nr:response regulator transcription factor [Actinomycetota bacterium]